MRNSKSRTNLNDKKAPLNQPLRSKNSLSEHINAPRAQNSAERASQRGRHMTQKNVDSVCLEFLRNTLFQWRRPPLVLAPTRLGLPRSWWCFRRSPSSRRACTAWSAKRARSSGIGQPQGSSHTLWHSYFGPGIPQAMNIDRFLETTWTIPISLSVKI